MKFSKQQSLYYPTQVQELLLQASMLQGERATKAWKQWRDSVDIENLDSESHHLLCLLYRNLITHRVEDENMARLKGVYRRTWYANQLFLKEAKAILKSLQESQIETIILQDAALTANVYQEIADRPIYSLDFFVLPNQLIPVIQVLKFLGWAPTSIDSDESLALRSIIEFQNSVNQRLYLHQHIFWAIPQNYTDQQVWRHKGLGEIDRFPAYLLDPTDQFLFICSRSRHRKNKQQLRWLVDAFMLLQSLQNDIDWGRLVAQAQRYQLVLPLKNLLTLLQEIFGVEIPAWVIPSLEVVPISYFELLDHQIFPGSWKLIIKANLVRLHYHFSNLKNQVMKLFSISPLANRGHQSYEVKSNH